MKNFVEKGLVMNYPIPAATTVNGGDLVFVGALVGVAVTTSSTEGALIACNLTGVFEYPKTAPLAINQGDRLYWNDGTDKITKTVTDKFAGVAFEAAGSNATTVLLKLVNEGAATGAAKAANIAAIATVDGSDPATTQALANATKAKVNAILVALKNAGIMVAD